MMDKPKKTKRKENHNGLWVPNEILNLVDIDDGCKMLLAHFYSFATKGCYQSNKTLATIFMKSEYTISRRIKKLSKYIVIKNPKGYYRTIWTRLHPQVSKAIEIHRKSKEVSGQNMSSPLRQNCRTDLVKSLQSSSAKSPVSLQQNCVTTNTETNTKTNTETAADLPLPAGGQASRLLEQRRAAAQDRIEQFKKRFGIGKKRAADRMSPQEFESRRQMIIKQLREA